MDKEQKAIERLKLAAEMSETYYGKPLIVTTSGGKDSDVCIALALAAGINFEVQHNHTTADAPETVYHEQEDTYKLLLASEQARGLQLRRNMMGELRGDWAARAAWFKSMREIGAYSINNILALEDMPDIAGGDEHYASLNYIPADLFRELSINRNEPKEGGENK